MSEVERLTQIILEDYRQELKLLLNWQNGDHTKMLALFAHIKEVEEELLQHVGTRDEVIRIGNDCYNAALKELMPYLWGWLRKG